MTAPHGYGRYSNGCRCDICKEAKRAYMIRANSVEVAKIFQARCRVEGCGWAGELLGTYQEANGDRQAHLDEHRRTEGES